MLKANSVTRQKKGKESIEEGSGHGADCLLTGLQGKTYSVNWHRENRLPGVFFSLFQLPTNTHIGLYNKAYPLIPQFVGVRICNTILYLVLMGLISILLSIFSNTIAKK